MRFLFGVACGALGVWAYQSGKLQGFNEVVSNDTIRQVASTVQDKVQRVNAPEIATPTPAEVAGRPAEPLPS